MIVTGLSANELVGALDARDVHFLTGGEYSNRAHDITPAQLLAELAMQNDARMRLAIIPLLLRRPELSSVAIDATQRVVGSARQTLKLYYTAAMLLQRLHHSRLIPLLGEQQALPDLFGAELGLSGAGNPKARLRELAERHAALTGFALNWIGTYEHAAQRLIRRLESEALWAQTPQA
jgi:hypothetical protein